MQFKTTLRKVGDKSLELTGRLGNQKHLAVLRDAFAIYMPLIIAGALAVLLITFVFGGWGATQTSILGWIANAKGDVNRHTMDANGLDTGWTLIEGTSSFRASQIGTAMFGAISSGTIGMMSLYTAFGIGYFLSKARGSETPVISGIVALGAFIVAVSGNAALFDATGLISSMIIAVVSAELFVVLTKNTKLEIKMPAGIPPAVARSFAKLFPSMIILAIVGALNLPFIIFGIFKGVGPSGNLAGVDAWNIGAAIYAGVQAPFLSFAGSNSGGLSVALVYVLSVSVMWFFGIHGSNVLLGIFTPIFMIQYTDNALHGAHNIFVQGTYDAFIWVGGAGATLGFIICVFIFSRNKSEREICKLGIGPAIFQINEPIVFGLPLVLNPKYIVPFVFTMPLLTITTYLGYTWFHVHPVTVMIPWTSTYGIGALLATAFDYKAFLLALFNLGVTILMWMPWVMLWSKKELQAEKTSKKSSKAKVRA